MSAGKRSGILFVPTIAAISPDIPVVVEALIAADKWGWDLVVSDVGPPGRDHTNYHARLSEMWKRCATEDHDLMVVEHDTVIHDDVFKQFAECPSTYCAFLYWIGASFSYGLGCTRFRAALIAGHPDLIDAAGVRWHKYPDGIPIDNTHLRLDTRIMDEARDRNLVTIEPGGAAHPCLHDPPVTHLHEYPMKAPVYGNEQVEMAEFRHRVVREDHA